MLVYFLCKMMREKGSPFFFSNWAITEVDFIETNYVLPKLA